MRGIPLAESIPIQAEMTAPSAGSCRRTLALLRSSHGAVNPQ
jgi:hypothetical protein